MRFEDKKILVTGGASGIGLAIAQAFLAEGATVVATDINQKALDAMSGGEGGRLLTRLSDAGSPAAIADLAQWLEGELGGLDVLVNNAGMAIMKNPEEMIEEEYHQQMNVLLTGPVFFVKHFAPMLRRSSNGSVVNISSASAVLTSNNYCPYAIAKAAIHKFTEDSVIQVQGIRHNCIMPGFIETTILLDAYGEGATDQLGGMLANLPPIDRIGQPGDIASAVLFLASDEASYVNGSNLLVDGGLSKLNTAVALAGGQVVFPA